MQYTRVRTFQHNQAPRHYYLVQALVDCPATCHVLHVAGQHYLVHAVVEVPATGQVLQAAGKNQSSHALIEIITKGPAL